MSFTRFSYRRSENRVFPVVAYANDLLPNREFRHQPPPRVVIRVSLKVSKFRASGRVKFIALGPPAPSRGRPLVNSTSPMLFQCPAAEHGGIAAVPHAGYQPKSAVSDARRDHTRSNMLGLGWRCPLWVISGHCAMSGSCPLYPRKWTSLNAITMSAKCQ